MDARVVQANNVTASLSSWNDLPNHNHDIELDGSVIMPSHIHGIIIINNIDVRAGSESVPFEVEGEGHPEVTGSLDSKDCVLWIAFWTQKCYFFPEGVSISLVCDIKGKGFTYLQAGRYRARDVRLGASGL